MAFWSTVAEYTNRYARETVTKTKNGFVKCAADARGAAPRRQNWIDTDPIELLVYVSLLIVMSYTHLDNVSLYWNTREDNGWNTISHPAVASRMTRDRFLDLSRMLCFRDDDNMGYLATLFGYMGGEQGVNHNESHYKLRKVWMVIATVSVAIASFFVAGTWIALDESMLAFTGALSFIMYMPAKPIKHGIKIFMACCSLTGAPLKFSIYTGTPSEAKQAQEKLDKKAAEKGGLAALNRLGGIVLGIIPDYCKITSALYFPRNVAVDNYYNYPSIHRALNALGLGMLGTFAARGKKPKVPSRDTFPFAYKDALKKKLPKGWFRQAIQVAVGDCHRRLLALVWLDNKLVKFLSSCCVKGAAANTYAKRKTKTSQGERVDVPAHPISVLYNKHMGGVDLLDQYMAKFPVGYKVRRWYMRVFFWLINLAITTVFIYMKVRAGPAWDVLIATGGAHLNFRLRLQDQLWQLAVKDGNYKKRSEVNRGVKRREEEAVATDKASRKDRARVDATPAKKPSPAARTPGSAARKMRSTSPPNPGDVPLYNGPVATEKENRGGHQWVKNEDEKQRACKMCVAALTRDEARAYNGNSKIGNKRVRDVSRVKRSGRHCSYRNCDKMALCKNHFAEHAREK